MDTSPASARRPQPLGRRQQAPYHSPSAPKTARAAAAESTPKKKLNDPQSPLSSSSPVAAPLLLPPVLSPSSSAVTSPLRTQRISFADRLSQLAVSGISSKEAKMAIVHPPTRVPPSLFLYKQNASQMSFAPSQHMIVSASSPSFDQQQQQQPDGTSSTGKHLPPMMNNRKRWLPAETPSGFDRMEMRYLAQVFDKVTCPGEVADACVPNERARRILNLNGDGSGDCAPEEVLVATAPVESALRLSHKMEGLLIGLHEVARLTAPASQDLTAMATLAVDEVKSVFYDLLQHVQVQKQNAKKEQTLRIEMEGVAARLRKELDDLTQDVAKLSARMAQHYEVKPEYLRNRENAPNILVPGAPTVEELTHKERRAYDTYVPSQNKSLHNTFVENVLTSATPGVKNVANFGRDLAGGAEEEAAFAAQSQAVMVSSERACRLPPGVSAKIQRRHPPITRDIGIDCTDLYFYGHTLIGGANNAAATAAPQSPGAGKGSFSSSSNSQPMLGSTTNLELLRHRSSVAHFNQLQFRQSSTAGDGSSHSPSGSSSSGALLNNNICNSTTDADNLFNFTLPAPKLYAHAGALFVQPAVRLFQTASTIQGRQSQVLGSSMQRFAGTGSVEQPGFAQVGDLAPSALKLSPQSYPQQQPQQQTKRSVSNDISGINVISSDDDADGTNALLEHNRATTGVMTPPAAVSRRGAASPTSTSTNTKKPKPPRGKRNRAGGAAAISSSPSSTGLAQESSLSVPPPLGSDEDSGTMDSPQASVGSFRRLASPSTVEEGGEAASGESSSGNLLRRNTLTSGGGGGAGGGNGFRRVGNAVVSLLRKRTQSTALNHTSAETQTDPWQGVSVEVQTTQMRDVFGMKIGGGGGGGSHGKGNRNSSKKLRDGTARSNSFGKASSKKHNNNNDNINDSTPGGGGTDASDIGSVLAGFQEELGFLGGSSASAASAAVKRDGGGGGSKAAAAASSSGEKGQSTIDLDEQALLEATGFVCHKEEELTAHATVNTDVTLCGPQLYKIQFLDAIVACNVRHFDGVVAHKTPDYAIVPKEVLERERAALRRSQHQQQGDEKDKKEGGGDDDDDDDDNVDAEKSPKKEDELEANPWGTGGNASFIGGNMMDVLKDAAASAGELLMGRARSSSVADSSVSNPDSPSNISRMSRRVSNFADAARQVAAGVANRKQQRTMHSHTILYAKSLPPLWRAELGQRPNFSGARIKAREWTLSVVMECYRSIDLLLVCATRPFPVNIVEFVQSKFGERKQARPYLLDLLVNAKVQSLSSMRCFAFVQLAELAGFAGIDDLPDVRASPAFLFYYLFITQRLHRTLSFRGIREFAAGALVLNREAVVALLDAHLCHVAASFASATEWESERRRYYSALLSLQRLSLDEMNVVRYMQQMQCVVDGTKCEDPSPLVYKAAAELSNDTDVWKKLEGLNTLVPLHADVVIYLLVRNHDSLVELVVDRARVLHAELEEKRAMRPMLVSTEDGAHPFEANVLPPPPMIAQQLLPVATPVAVPVHPKISEMGTSMLLR